MTTELGGSVADIGDANSLHEIVRYHAFSDPSREALRYLQGSTLDGTVLTYGDLDRAASAVADQLTRTCEPGDRCLLLYPFGPEFIVAFLGCLYAGVVAVPTPLPGRYRHERRRIHSIAQDSGAVLALTDEASRSDVLDWMHEDQIDGLQVVVTGVVTEQADHREPMTVGRDTLAMLQYTSGSTGDPKGVMLKHGNLLDNIGSINRTFSFDENTVFGGWIPHFHDMGLIGQLLPALVVGSRCIVMSPRSFAYRPHMWLKMIEEFDIDWSPAPNFAYELCCRRITDEQLAKLDLSRWRYAVNGSEPIHAKTLNAFAERFAPAGFRAESFTPCYGMAETAVFISGDPAPPTIITVDAETLEDNKVVEASEDRAVRTLVSCGVPGEFDVRIVDPAAGYQLPSGAVGEIWISGASVSAGYWNNPDATEQTFAGELDGIDGVFLRTGDLGVLYEDKLYVTGRIKEMMTMHGRNLYPYDVEHELRSAHPQLAGGVGAVFTVTEEHSTDPGMVITHEVKGSRSEDELRELAIGMKETIAREMGATAACVALLRPGTVRRTTSGKIQRAEMRALFRAGELASLYVHGDAP